jgi:small-conductance mechanosensitive channel
MASLAALFLIVYYVIRFGVAANLHLPDSSRWRSYLPFLERLRLALFAIMAIILVGRVVERLIDRSHHSRGVRYNLVRLTRLLSYVLIAIVGVSFLFQNLYAAALSFGIISLVLGFALQAPITSFIGWLYIVFRQPYHVGDRIQLPEVRGDVIEIGYLYTLVRECHGDYLGNDRASGRIIHFPNSVVLKSQVINYSGPFKPFIWNETALQIAYTSDLAFLEACLLEAADADFHEHYVKRAEHPRDTAAAVYFRVNTYAWLEAVVSYPVEPEDTTGRRNRVLRRALPALNSDPDKVQFPQGALR